MQISFNHSLYEATVYHDGFHDISTGKVGDIFCTVFNMLNDVLSANGMFSKKYDLLKQFEQSYWLTREFPLTLPQASNLFTDMKISYRDAIDAFNEVDATGHSSAFPSGAPLFLSNDSEGHPFPRSFESCLTSSGVAFIPHGLEDVISLDLYYSIQTRRISSYATCNCCGKLFVRKKGARFCSDRCRNKHSECVKNPYEKITRKLQKQYNSISHEITNGPCIYENWFEYSKNRTKQVNILIELHKIYDQQICTSPDIPDFLPDDAVPNAHIDEDIGFPSSSTEKCFGDFPIYYEKGLIPVPSEQMFEKDLRAYWKKLCK